MFHLVLIVVIAIIGPALTTTTIGDPVTEKLHRNFVDKHQINYEHNLLLWLRSSVEEKQFESESQEGGMQMNSINTTTANSTTTTTTTNNNNNKNINSNININNTKNNTNNITTHTTNSNNINNNNNSYNTQKTFERRKLIGKSSFNTKITDKFHDFIKVH